MSRNRRSEGNTALAEDLIAELLAGYRQRRLEPAQLLALDDHLAICGGCRKMLRGLMPMRDALASLRANLETAQPVGEHLTGNCLRAYAEDRLEAVDQELAESHIECCESCRKRAR